MGRADQSTKVRGLFVHPSHVGELVRRHPVVRRARLVVSRPQDLDVMTLRAEVSPEDRPRLAEALAGTLRDLTQLRAEVELVDLRALPNDGKVIDDQRPVG
jgi:phenylacetate-CoA ligase